MKEQVALSAGSSDNPLGLEPEYRRQLLAVLSHHGEIAESLDQSSRRFFGRSRRQCRSLSQFFRRSPTPERAVCRPDVFAICAPLMNPQSNAGPVSGESSGVIESWQIDSAVTKGLDQIQRFQSSFGKVAVLLAYPLVLLALAMVIFICYLMFLVPIFDQMFQEFGLNLGPTTQMIVNASRFVNGAWPVFVGLAALAGMSLLGLLIFHRSRDLPVWYGFFGSLFASRRETLAEWAMHLAMLCQSGAPITEAIRLAGASSQDSRIRGRCQSWVASNVDQDSQPTGVLAGLSGCRLLSNAIGRFYDHSLDLRGTVVLLSEVASIQHERVRQQRLQLLAWLSPISVCLVSGVVGLLVVALLAPLVSLIESLSS